MCAVGFGQLQNAFRARGALDPATAIMRKLWTGPGTLVGDGTDAVRTYTTKIWRVNQLETQNRALRDRVRGLTLYGTTNELLAGQLAEAQDLLKLNVPGRTKFACRIINYFIAENRVRINAGSAQGVRPMMPVVSSGGLIGQVVAVDSGTSDVTLLTSPTIKLTAMVTGKNKVVGLVRGEAPTRLILDIQDAESHPQVGDVLVTAGLTDSYPRGVIIGDIVQVSDTKEFGLMRAFVSPRARLEDISAVVVLE